MTRQTDKCAAISGAIAGLVLFAIVSVACELTLLDEMFNCERDRIDKWTRAVVVSETNQTTTFLLPNGANCSVVYVGGSHLIPNATVEIYKSESGFCASNEQKYFCGKNVVLFNVLFFLCGGALLTCLCGIAVVHDLLMMFWKHIEQTAPLISGPPPPTEEPTVELVELSTSSSSK